MITVGQSMNCDITFIVSMKGHDTKFKKYYFYCWGLVTFYGPQNIACHRKCQVWKIASVFFDGVYRMYPYRNIKQMWITNIS